MTVSRNERSQNCWRAVTLMLEQLGDGAIDDTLFDPADASFQDIIPTTWSELERDGWVEQIKETQQYRFTGLGWLQAIKSAGKLDDNSLSTRAGPLFATMKAYVKGRQKPCVVKLSELALKSAVPEGVVFNIIESNVLEEHFKRRGAMWHERGRLVFIPVDFNVEPADVNMLFKEEMLNRIEKLEEELAQTKEELSIYKCPHCGAPLSTTGPIELDEHTEDTVEVFACGYSTGGWNERPCPSDPKFPKLEDYEFKFTETQTRWGTECVCLALSKTDMARKVSLMSQRGRTRDEAQQKVVESYKQLAKPWR